MCIAWLARSGAVLFVPTLTILSFVVALVSPSTDSVSLPMPSDWFSHLRVRELCVHKQGGHEGTTIKGFLLSQAFIITTPGLRFFEAKKNSPYSSQTCRFESFSKNHPSTLLQNYLEVLKYKSSLNEGNYKARSAFKIFSPVPNSSQCQDGMMTSLGIAQSIWLGEHFARAYHNRWSLKNTVALAYTEGDEVLFQSASAILYGLLRDKQFVKNHIKKLGRNYAPAGHNEFKAKDITTDPTHYLIKSSFENEHHLFKDKSSPTGRRGIIDHLVGSDFSAKSLISYSAVKYCPTMGIKSIWTNSNSSEETKFQSKSLPISNILSLSDDHNEYLAKDFFFQSYAHSRSTPFRKFLQMWMLSSKSKHNPEINLVTVDDLFLLSLLTSLNKTVSQHIAPVSRFVIEKFSYNFSSQENHVSAKSADGQHFADILDTYQIFHNQFLRILLNGRVITREIGDCDSDPMAGLGLCSLHSVFGALNDQEEFSPDEKVEL